jgi:hypothetical protein
MNSTSLECGDLSPLSDPRFQNPDSEGFEQGQSGDRSPHSKVKV